MNREKKARELLDKITKDTDKITKLNLFAQVFDLMTKKEQTLLLDRMKRNLAESTL